LCQKFTVVGPLFPEPIIEYMGTSYTLLNSNGLAIGSGNVQWRPTLTGQSKD